MDSEQKKILVAEDDPGIADVLSLMFEDAGYVVYKTADRKTLDDIKKNKPNVLLLDIWMSGVDGRDICRTLKSDEATREIPVIMMSANKDAAQIAKNCGADDFITKPFEMDEILAKVDKYIK